MRYGENALDVIERVKKKIDELKPSFPEGVELTIAYDRSALIERVDRHAEARAHRGGHLGQPRDHAVPAALPQRAAADPVAADQRRAVVHPDVPARHPVDDHEPGRHRHRHRRHGRRRDRHDRGAPQEAGARRRPAPTAHAAADRGGQGGHAGDLLLAADHRGRVPARVHADRAGGAPVQAARLHEDVRHADLGAALDHLRARAARPAHPRQDQARERTTRSRASSSASTSRSSTSRCGGRSRRVAIGAVRAASAMPLALPPRQRVHAAAQRGRPALHADHLPEHLDRGGEAPAPAPGPHAAQLPRGRDRLRQGRPRRDADRSGADHDGRDDRAAAAAEPVAQDAPRALVLGLGAGLAQAGAAAALAGGAAR